MILEFIFSESKKVYIKITLLLHQILRLLLNSEERDSIKFLKWSQGEIVELWKKQVCKMTKRALSFKVKACNIVNNEYV